MDQASLSPAQRWVETDKEWIARGGHLKDVQLYDILFDPERNKKHHDEPGYPGANGVFSGETLMWIAAIRAAIDDILNPRVKRTKNVPNVCEDCGLDNYSCALAWVASKDFQEVCENCGIEADNVRRIIYREKEQNEKRKAASRNTRLSGKAGRPPRSFEVVGPIHCSQETGCCGADWGLCGYGEPELV